MGGKALEDLQNLLGDFQVIKDDFQKVQTLFGDSDRGVEVTRQVGEELSNPGNDSSNS